MLKRPTSLPYIALAVAIVAAACGGAAAPTATRAPAAQPPTAAARTPTPTTVAGLPGIAPTLPAPTAAPRVAASRGKIVEAVVSDIGTTNTLVGNISDRGSYMPSVNIGLTATDKHPGFRPVAAKGWDFSPDGKILTFTIREDVIFHDGTKVTVDDWVYRYDAWLRPKEYGVPGAIPPSAPPVPTSIEKVDSSRFRIAWATADPSFLGAYNNTGWNKGVYSKAYIQRVGWDEFGKKPIGAGPYKLVSWTPSDKIVLEAHDQYLEGTPQVKTVDILVVPEDTTRVAMFLTGEADISVSLPPSMLSQVERRPGAQLYTVPNFMTASIMFQAGTKTIPGTDIPNPFGDIRVRKAVAHAIDRKAILERIAGRGGAPVKGPYSEYTFGYDGDNIVEYEYDPKKARQLLEEAKYPFDQTFTLLTYPLSPPMPAAMEAAATYMQAIGMKVQYNLREVSASTRLWAEKRSNPSAVGVYPIQGVRSAAFVNVAEGIFSYYNSKDGSFPQNDPRLDALIEEGRVTFDLKAREDANKRLFRYLHEQAQYITLYTMRENHAIGPRITYNFPPQPAWLGALNYVNWKPGNP